MAYWLKMVGAADDPLDNRWIDVNPELLREVRSPRRPSGIKRKDLLVYYAAHKLAAGEARARVRAADSSGFAGRSLRAAPRFESP